MSSRGQQCVLMHSSTGSDAQDSELKANLRARDFIVNLSYFPPLVITASLCKSLTLWLKDQGRYGINFFDWKKKKKKWKMMFLCKISI